MCPGVWGQKHSTQFCPSAPHLACTAWQNVRCKTASPKGGLKVGVGGRFRERDLLSFRLFHLPACTCVEHHFISSLAVVSSFLPASHTLNVSTLSPSTCIFCPSGLTAKLCYRKSNKKPPNLGVGVYAPNPRTWEAEVGDFKFQASWVLLGEAASSFPNCPDLK